MMLPHSENASAENTTSQQIAGVLTRMKRGLGRCGCGARASVLQGNGSAEQRIARCASCARRHRPITDGERFVSLRQAQGAMISDADRIRQLRWARLTSLRRGAV